MPISTEEVKQSLLDRSARMFEARSAHLVALKAFSAAGIDLRYDSIDPVWHHFQALLTRYFTDLCSLLTRQHCCNTPAVVSLPSGMFTFQREFSRRHSDEPGLAFKLAERLDDADLDSQANQLSIVSEVIDSLPITEAVTSLCQQVSELPAKGYAQMAASLVRFFRLSANLRGNSHYAPKFKSGRYVFLMSSVGRHDYRSTDEIQANRDYLHVIEQQTGCNFGSALDELFDAVRALSYSDEKIESRTRLGKGQPVEIRCFKEKYEIHFTPNAFEALQAFICLNGNDEDADAITSLAELAQVAA